jgi:hypothetical protein
MGLDPERLTAALSALAGGAFYGLVNAAGLLMAGQPIGRQDLLRAALNAACAMIGGLLVAYFLQPNIAAFVPWESLRDAHGLGFVIGAFAWVLAPAAYKLVRAWGERQVRERAK